MCEETPVAVQKMCAIDETKAENLFSTKVLKINSFLREGIHLSNSSSLFL